MVVCFCCLRQAEGSQPLGSHPVPWGQAGDTLTHQKKRVQAAT